MAEDLHCSRRTVSAALRRLVDKGLLQMQTSDKGTVITMCHWEALSTGKDVYGADLAS